MKKLLLSLVLMLAFGFSMSAKTLYTCQFGSEYNQESVSSYATTWTVKVGNNTWTVDSCNNNLNGWAYIKCGRKGVASTGMVTTAFAIPEAITNVVVVIDKITAASVESIKLQTSTVADFATIDTTVEIAKDDYKAGEMKFALSAPKANMYYRVSFACASASANGVVQLSMIKYNDDEAAGIEEVADIAAFKAKADKANPVIIKNDVEVLYQIGLNLFIQDNSGRILIYGAIDQKYTPGDIIPGGFQGVYSVYGGNPQITKAEGLKPASSNKPLSPRTVTIATITEADVFDYVVLENLAIESVNNRNIVFKQGDATFAGYNQFNTVVTLPTDFEGKTYTVKAIIGSYNGTVQIQPVEFEESQSSAIETIVAEDAPVEYFSIQGIRVANPEPGLYIRRQGNKVSKVIIR